MKAEYLFDAQLIKLLERALLEHNFCVSATLSAGGGSKSVSYVGLETITRELNAARARQAQRLSRGSIRSQMNYPAFAL